MEIKIKIKRPGKGEVKVSFACTDSEFAAILKAEKHDKMIRKEKKNDM